VAGHAKADLGKGKLKRKVARGGLATVLSEGFRGLSRVVTTAVLARLLTPDDFGVVAMVAGFTALLQGIADGGLSAAAIRQRNLTPQQSTNLFWCNAATSLAVAIASVAAAPLVARFVGDDRIIQYVPLAALGLVISGLGAQQRIILTRELKFGSLVRAEIASITVGFIVALSLAALGAGPWSILSGQVATNTCLTATRWTVSGWRPGWFRPGHGTRRLLRRGFGLLLSNAFNSIRTSSDSLILGRFAGAAQVGLYSKAFGLLVLPMSRVLKPLGRVAVPVLVQLWNEPDRFRKSYFRLVAFVSLVSTPVTALMFFGAEDVIRILLGEQFLPSVDLFRILAFSSIGMATAATTGWVQQASGRVKRQLALTIWTSAVVVAANVTGAWLGGAEGMAVGFVVGLQLVRHPACSIALRGSPVRYRSFLAASTPALLVALAGSAAMYVPEYMLELPRPFTSLAVTWSVGLVTMAAMAFAWPRVRQDIRGVLEMVRAAGPGKGRKPAAEDDSMPEEPDALP
jgi:PST family polysaccharide transporter